MFQTPKGNTIIVTMGIGCYLTISMLTDFTFSSNHIINSESESVCHFPNDLTLSDGIVFRVLNYLYLSDIVCVSNTCKFIHEKLKNVWMQSITCFHDVSERVGHQTVMSSIRMIFTIRKACLCCVIHSTSLTSPLDIDLVPGVIYVCTTDT